MGATRAPRRLAGLVVGIALACLALGTAAATSTSAAEGRPSLAALAAQIKTATAAAHAPDLTGTVPPLAQLDPLRDVTIPGVPVACYTKAAAVPADAATRCAFGDTSAKRTVYLLGGSEAAMWLPALNPVAKSQHLRLIMTARPGCPPWPGQSAADVKGVDQSGCVTWVKSELALLAQLRPAVVMPAGLGFHAGSGKAATFAQQRRALDKFAALARPARVVLLGTIPVFASLRASFQPNTCLARAADVRTCEYPPSVVVTPFFVRLYTDAAQTGHFPYVDVRQLFCAKQRCAVFVANHIVYLDRLHANRFYMDYVADALGERLRGLL